MKREKGFEVPFAVMRQIGTSMEDQLVSGFTRVIRSGAYADGTALPGIRKLAVMFGVSEITVRNAVKRLCRDGLLAARPRVGLTVCAPGGRFWRGTVLGVKAGPPGMYFASVLENAIGDVLRKSGWLYSSVSVSSEKDGVDFAVLDMMLQSSVSLVITFNAPQAVSRRIEKTGVRFAEVNPAGVSDKGALCLKVDMSSAIAELAEALKASGVKSVLSVYQHPSESETYSAPLESVGLKVRRLHVKPTGGHNTQEAVQRAGLVAFERILAKGGIDEDAVVSNDDYLSAGILAAFDRHGVRMPEDVRFATLANKGLGPVHIRNLSRIELDAEEIGRSYGGTLLCLLENESVTVPNQPGVRFIRGETI